MLEAQPLPRALRWPLMLLPFALWGTAMAAMRPLLPDGSPLLVASLRLLPAGLLLLLASLVLRRPQAVAPADWPWLLLFALVDGALFQGLLTHGLPRTGAGLGSVLIDSQPLLVALLARTLFQEAINPVGWLGMLLGLAGILCLGLPPAVLQQWWLQGPAVLDSHAWSHGELWMLAAAAAMAVGTVLCRYATRASDPLVVTGWHMLIGGTPLLLGAALAPLLDPSAPPLLPHWSAVQWGLMTYSAVFGSAVAYGLFFWFASQGDLTGFTALTFLTPVFAVFSALLWLGERLAPLQWLGVGLALASVVLVHQRQPLWQGRWDAAARSEPVPPSP